MLHSGYLDANRGWERLVSGSQPQRPAAPRAASLPGSGRPPLPPPPLPLHLAEQLARRQLLQHRGQPQAHDGAWPGPGAKGPPGPDLGAIEQALMRQLAAAKHQHQLEQDREKARDRQREVSLAQLREHVMREAKAVAELREAAAGLEAATAAGRGRGRGLEVDQSPSGAEQEGRAPRDPRAAAAWRAQAQAQAAQAQAPPPMPVVQSHALAGLSGALGQLLRQQQQQQQEVAARAAREVAVRSREEEAGLAAPSGAPAARQPSPVPLPVALPPQSRARAEPPLPPRVAEQEGWAWDRRTPPLPQAPRQLQAPAPAPPQQRAPLLRGSASPVLPLPLPTALPQSLLLPAEDAIRPAPKVRRLADGAQGSAGPHLGLGVILGLGLGLPAMGGLGVLVPGKASAVEAQAASDHDDAWDDGPEPAVPRLSSAALSRRGRKPPATAPPPARRADSDSDGSGSRGRASTASPVTAPAPAPAPAPALTAVPTGLAVAAASSAAGPDGRRVLVAKMLTRSDARTRRLILPRMCVEANIPEALAAHSYCFDVTDQHRRRWGFVIRSWPNGSNPKPVYVLEHISEFVKAYSITSGDVMGLLRCADGSMQVEVNTAVLLAAAKATTGLRTRTRGAAAPANGGGSRGGGGGGRKRARHDDDSDEEEEEEAAATSGDEEEEPARTARGGGRGCGVEAGMEVEAEGPSQALAAALSRGGGLGQLVPRTAAVAARNLARTHSEHQRVLDAMEVLTSFKAAPPSHATGAAVEALPASREHSGHLSYSPSLTADGHHGDEDMSYNTGIAVLPAGVKPAAPLVVLGGGAPTGLAAACY